MFCFDIAKAAWLLFRADCVAIGPSAIGGLFTADPCGKLLLGAIAQRVAEMGKEKRRLGAGAFEGIDRVVVMRMIDTGRGREELGQPPPL